MFKYILLISVILLFSFPIIKRCRKKSIWYYQKLLWSLVAATIGNQLATLTTKSVNK
jgi:hypothetical protein